MNVNIVLFDDFDVLDVFGPAQIFGMAAKEFHINYLSVHGGIVNSSNGCKIWTEILIPNEVEDILLVPGGRGAKKLLHLEPKTLQVIKESAENADYCLMVGNGSALLAQTGLLFHRRIANYEYDENWKRMFSAGLTYTENIRWIADGKYYSCSSSVAGIDMTLGLIADAVDVSLAENIAKQIGYQWDADDEDGIFL